ncbi:MAG: NAD(P)(+) transhydrogenase (Re/Si-specific) subunit beta [Bacillota bacterium]|jgi:NAD/NADP transhydrogenase beta subunit
MNNIAYNLISLVLALGILYGINLMSSPKTAVRGNSLGALFMFTAIMITLLHNGIVTIKMLWIYMLIGALIGAYLATHVKMIQMPETVALLNGFGGGASALVAITVLLQVGEITAFSRCTAVLALAVGGLTFSGSMIAAGKLSQKINQRPITYPGHSLISNLSILVMLFLIVFSAISAKGVALVTLSGLIVSLFFGVWFTIRVGGADMPITISLLNSFSGVAGAIAGLAILDPLLVAVGGIVGASGLLLTQIMCRAMNRSLIEILTGKTTVNGNGNGKANALSVPKEAVLQKDQIQKKEEKKLTEGDLLRTAKKVVIVPGYGMALAQAQQEVKQLADLMEQQGKEVKFAIHPVAGRMPGHMNVLLAEVDVPYENLYEMDVINPEFKETDLVLVVGANDVVNPAANTAEGTPIYGMPVLQVEDAKNVIICNFDTKPGYAGVDNPLYQSTKAVLLLGDAKVTVAGLVKDLLRTNVNASEESDQDSLDKESQNIKTVMKEAKKVVIVPGYGMALAQAQQEVKQLADLMEQQGKEVKFAIHPVAGRMPGHMNVLLAEVDVPYENLYEMDVINPEFKDTDLVVVVGANDVVNPAANTAEGTPIYGMPILQVEQAKNIIICNFDTKPGYAGVDNPLYQNTKAVLLLGDAKETVAGLAKYLLKTSADAPEESVDDSMNKESVDIKTIMEEAKKVVIVPGYGMALAQAQQEVKQLADLMEQQGKEVKFAIHPVAGRMPGHMNVLLAEVDVPYENLYEMDVINPEFKDTDLVVVVGANDVVNPAANTAEGTPIYGMPILQVEQAKNIIICNFDTKPGYAGVDNPLYQNTKAVLLLGDAKETVGNLVHGLVGA